MLAVGIFVGILMLQMGVVKYLTMLELKEMKIILLQKNYVKNIALLEKV